MARRRCENRWGRILRDPLKSQASENRWGRIQRQPDNSYIAYSYDAAHRLTGIQDNLSHRIAYTLDTLGNRTAESTYDPGNVLRHTRTRVYDALNRLAQDIGALATEATTYGYDANGNLKTVTDPLNHSTTNVYDALNRLIQATDANNGVSTYAYNGRDQVTRVTDPRNLATPYTRNGLGDQLTEVSPDRGTVTYTYDSGGNVKTLKDARNQTTTYTWDALNRLTQATYGDATVTSYVYDAGSNGKGRLTGMTDPSSVSTTYTWNKRGELTGKTQTVSSLARTVGYAYDSVGRVSQITYPSGKAVNYTYTGGQLTGIAVGSTPLVSSITHAPFGPVTGWNWGGGGAAHPRPRDTDYRLSRYPAGPATRTLAYDAASNLLQLSDSTSSSTNPLSRVYGYDTLERLASEQSVGIVRPGLNVDHRWSYEANGNLLTASSGASTIRYSYAATSNRISARSGGPVGLPYAYDAAGNLRAGVASTGASATTPAAG